MPNTYTADSLEEMGLKVTRYEQGTWLQPEEAAYPNGGETRIGAAIWADGKLRRVYAGIPDTYFSIPAHGKFKGKYVKGYLDIDNEKVLRFNVCNSHKDII